MRASPAFEWGSDIRVRRNVANGQWIPVQCFSSIRLLQGDVIGYALGFSNVVQRRIILQPTISVNSLYESRSACNDLRGVRAVGSSFRDIPVPVSGIVFIIDISFILRPRDQTTRYPNRIALGRITC